MVGPVTAVTAGIVPLAYSFCDLESVAMRNRVSRMGVVFVACFILVMVGALLATGLAAPTPAIGDETLPSTYVPSGKVMYQQYCASCHGISAKGDGPLASLLIVRPADLTTLTKRHGGRFPAEYVKAVLEFGPSPNAHGTSDMPAWGPLFRYFDKRGEAAVQQRIKNLSDYLASRQEP